MFLVLGILIVLFLITIRVVVQPARSITRPGEFDTLNIRNEFSNVQKYSIDNWTNITNNILNFTDFIYTRLDQRKIAFTGIYLNGYISKSNSSLITVTLGNYLGSTMSNVNISFGNSSGEQGSYLISSLANKNTNSTNLTFSVLAEQKHINVTYTLNGIVNKEFFTFTPRSGYSTVVTLYDLNYTILDKVTKDSFVQTDYL